MGRRILREVASAREIQRRAWTFLHCQSHVVLGAAWRLLVCLIVSFARKRITYVSPSSSFIPATRALAILLPLPMSITSQKTMSASTGLLTVQEGKQIEACEHGNQANVDLAKNAFRFFRIEGWFLLLVNVMYDRFKSSMGLTCSPSDDWFSF